jgi:predicted RNA-binding protein YlxR (DUF448 family)
MVEENLRRDIFSKKSYPRKALFRFVVSNGSVVYDPSGHQPGRGFYLQKNLHAVELAAKNNLLAHYGGAPEAPGLYESLRQAL